MGIDTVVKVGTRVLIPAGAVLAALGTKLHHDSKRTIEDCQAALDAEIEDFEVVRKKTVQSTDELGKLELEIQGSFERFVVAFEKIKNKPRFNQKELEGGFELPKLKVGELRKVSVNAVGILGGVTAMVGSGAFAGAAIYGGTLAVGVSSTGTPIVLLSGAAAKNAALAALGGGSIAAGGGGMAAGAALLGGAVAAAAIVAGGTALTVKGLMDRGKAKKAMSILDEATAELEASIEFLERLRSAADAHRSAIGQVYSVYLEQVERLEALVEGNADYKSYAEEDKTLLSNNILLVRLLKEMSETALVAGKEDEVLRDVVDSLSSKASAVLGSMD